MVAETQMTNTYTSQEIGGDYVIIYIWDKETRERIQHPISIDVIP